MELIAPVFSSYCVNSESVTYTYADLHTNVRTYRTARRYIPPYWRREIISQEELIVKVKILSTPQKAPDKIFSKF